MSAASRQHQAREWLLSADAAACPRVKLCGMSRDEDVLAVAQARPDMCGFIVNFPKSHRNISPGQLAHLCEVLDEADACTAAAVATSGLPVSLHPIWRVGVFVDEPLDSLIHLVREGSIDLVQLHGNESNAYVSELRHQTRVGTIQAYRVQSEDDAARAEGSAADMVLLDNGQGTGEAFDWSYVPRVRRPFILAGGLNPENVGQALAEVRPWGVDMSSGIETEKLKDPAKIEAAVRAVQTATRWRV